MNRALKKYKKADYWRIRLCPRNWALSRLVDNYGDVKITLIPKEQVE
jgi:hypothetical protein